MATCGFGYREKPLRHNWTQFLMSLLSLVSLAFFTPMQSKPTLCPVDCSE